MRLLSSHVAGSVFPFFELEEKLKPLGFHIGGNWEYDHGYFDCKLKEGDGYLYVRLPFETIQGSLDSDDAIVELGTPFLLNHKIRLGNDETAESGNITASFNQFQTPVDKDAEVNERYIVQGQHMVDQVEAELYSD